jgi:glycerophosphoryl diester phosphodiesterase
VTTTRAPRPLIVAHRGAAARAPEHTIPAYEAAVAAGVDALWLDVQETADRHLVVVHDDLLDRTTNGRGPVRARTVRELKRLDAGRWFGWRFRGQRIQTLSEVLERFRERAGFVVALRAGSDLYPDIEERALGLLHLHGAAERTLVASFDHHALVRCHALDADITLGARVAGRLLDPGGLAPPGVLTALCLDAALILERDVVAARDAGLETYLEGVADAADARRVAPWRPTALVMGSDFDS